MHLFQQMLDTGRAPRCVQAIQAESNVFSHRHVREERIVLKDNADASLRGREVLCPMRCQTEPVRPAQRVRCREWQHLQ